MTLPEIAAWLGGGAALLGAGISVWLAILLTKAERRVTAAVTTRLAAEEQGRQDKHARDNAEAARDAARQDRDDLDTKLERAQALIGDLYDELQKAGAPGAAGRYDDRIERMYPDANDHSGEAGPDGT